VSNIEKEALAGLKEAESELELDATHFWTFLIGESEFQFAVLGTQRITYASLFFAYEDFLATTIRSREPAYSSKRPNPSLKDAFSEHFGGPLTDFCWNHDEVDLARLVRHAIDHNGGRFGGDLQKHQARFVEVTPNVPPSLAGSQLIVINGKIQITPLNSRHLFSVLKDRVTKIVEQVK